VVTPKIINVTWVYIRVEMASISVIAATIFSISISWYLFWFFHEYTHWVAGKLFLGDPKVLYRSWHKIPYPYAVKYRELEQMPNLGVRIAGISPHVVWTTVAISYLVDGLSVIDMDILQIINGIAEGMYSTPFPELTFIFTSTLAGASVSPSDLVATFSPQNYRRYTGQELSHCEWLRVLLGQFD